MLDVAAYLARIQYSGPTEPTAATLRDLHRAHMLAVPFENLDIHLGRRIVCQEEGFLAKVIFEHRGGFCYELNGAFAALLRELGFRVTLFSARVSRPDGSEGLDLAHLCLRVDILNPPESPIAGTEAWLADVGFGDSFLEPLLMRPNLEQPQFGHVYRLVERSLLSASGATGETVLDMQVRTDGAWKRQYSFSPEPRQLGDFAGMCHYQQTSPDSHFTRQRICSLARLAGRITLSDLKLIETGEGYREERDLSGDAEWSAILRERFGIVLPGV